MLFPKRCYNTKYSKCHCWRGSFMSPAIYKRKRNSKCSFVPTKDFLFLLSLSWNITVIAKKKKKVSSKFNTNSFFLLQFIWSFSLSLFSLIDTKTLVRRSFIYSPKGGLKNSLEPLDDQFHFLTFWPQNWGYIKTFVLYLYFDFARLIEIYMRWLSNSHGFVGEFLVMNGQLATWPE